MTAHGPAATGGPAVRRALAALLLVAGLLAACTPGHTHPRTTREPAVHAAAARAFPGGDGRRHTLTWDSDSLKIDGRRLTVWSGEFHYWRLPSPPQWRDVLQKMKAAGFNAVSLYFFWGYHSTAPGAYDFTGIRDIDRLLTDAQQAGLYVIARPGPYINAETSMGGLPAYRTDYPGRPRSTDPPDLAADLEWLHAVDGILARHQVTDGGGSVLAYQVENEQYPNGPAQHAYMDRLEHAVRADGITVPLFHNDPGGGHGNNVPGGPGGSGLDLYAFDSYPLGFDCAGRRNRLADFETRIRRYSPHTPVFLAEGQGGAFTHWGRPYQATACARFADPAFTREFAVGNLANGATLANSYMEYGGTDWGWTGDPSAGFTSYDYGAALSEDRGLTPKLAVQKEFGYLQQALPPIASARAVAPPRTTATGGGPVEATQRLSTEDARASSVTGHGTRLIYLRHRDSNDTSTTRVTLRLDLGGAAGRYPRVPRQPGTALTLDGRDAKVVVADYAFGPHRLVYTTSQLLTRLTAGRDLLVLDGTRGEPGETVLRYRTRPRVTALGGPPVHTTWDAARGDLRLNYTHGRPTTVRITGDGSALTVLVGDREGVATTWQPETGGPQDVLVQGPELARTAHSSGTRLDLTGDTTGATRLRVFAPRVTRTLTWNGHPLATRRDPAGAFTATLPGPQPPRLPALTTWRAADSDPERTPAFDDSGWAEAIRTTAANPRHRAGKAAGVVLDADEYGFHEGDVWYRGHYTPRTASRTVTVTARTGTAGLAMAWLDGRYLGAQGDGRHTYRVPRGLTRPGRPAELSVLVRNMGHYQDWEATGRSMQGRGLADVAVPGSGRVRWRTQGAAGGPAPADTARGPYNNGGLYGERAGWHLPGAPDADHVPEEHPAGRAVVPRHHPARRAARHRHRGRPAHRGPRRAAGPLPRAGLRQRLEHRPVRQQRGPAAGVRHPLRLPADARGEHRRARRHRRAARRRPGRRPARRPGHRPRRRARRAEPGARGPAACGPAAATTARGVVDWWPWTASSARSSPARPRATGSSRTAPRWPSSTAGRSSPATCWWCRAATSRPSPTCPSPTSARSSPACAASPAPWSGPWRPRAPSWPRTTGSASRCPTSTCTSCRATPRTACAASSGPADATRTRPPRPQPPPASPPNSTAPRNRPPRASSDPRNAAGPSGTRRDPAHRTARS
jgi:Glycosyl hydrolases family 35/Beta-galactosidase, domain 2/Beta-galactosidase, domain 3/Beta-galactosidase jelly roll domain